MQPWLTLEDVTVQYPSTRACDAVTLHINAGEILGLAGMNGAGKSTLIKVLAGLQRHTAGSIGIDGVVTDVPTPAVSQDLGIAVVHQDLQLAPALTVAENIYLGLGYPTTVGLLRRDVLHDKARTTLAALDAQHIDVTESAQALSIADQRLVTIARALAQDARLLILDEPTASLTEREVDSLHRTMLRLRARGMSLIFVTHRLDEMLELCDRVVVMRDGRLIADEPRPALTRSSLVTLIGGQALVFENTRNTTQVGSEPVLTVSDLTLAAKVSDVSLDVFPGEVLGIGGLCGSGRSELLQAIFGALRPVSGSVRVAGHGGTITNPCEAVAAGIALLPEDRKSLGTFPAMSIRGNITIASLGRVRRMPWLPVPAPRKESTEAAARIQQLNIKCRNELQEVGLLSGGNQQKVMFGKWLSTRANIYLLDEPTHGVDVHSKAEIYKNIRALATSGSAVVFVSSDFAELAEVCDRIVILREGRRVAELTGTEVNEQTIIEKCYENEGPAA